LISKCAHNTIYLFFGKKKPRRLGLGFYSFG
jgi:hypothetical protein